MGAVSTNIGSVHQAVDPLGWQRKPDTRRLIVFSSGVFNKAALQPVLGAWTQGTITLEHYAVAPVGAEPTRKFIISVLRTEAHAVDLF